MGQTKNSKDPENARHISKIAGRIRIRNVRHFLFRSTEKFALLARSGAFPCQTGHKVGGGSLAD